MPKASEVLSQYMGLPLAESQIATTCYACKTKQTLRQARLTNKARHTTYRCADCNQALILIVTRGFRTGGVRVGSSTILNPEDVIVTVEEVSKVVIRANRRARNHMT